MTDKVLTDEEKEALLDGVATGEVEVQSAAGPLYAEVTPFEVPARSRLISNSFPRLQSLNVRVANRLSKQAEQLVNAETEVTAAGIEACQYGEFCERTSGLSLVVEFSAKPLEGSGLLVLHAELVAHLVEAFYGGVDNETTHQVSEFFTRGEISVAALFCKEVFGIVEDIWRPVMSTTHKQEATHQNSDIIEGFDASDRVVCAQFELSFLNNQHTFFVVWPVSMLAPLLPVFEGQKRERDPAQDALWERSLRSRLTGSVVGISSRVGNSRMSLGEVARLAVGDVIDIDNPRLSTIFVKQVPVLEGHFGVHEGKYAIEATEWLGSASDKQA
jgi:flagellar motor switch protein FliM